MDLPAPRPLSPDWFTQRFELSRGPGPHGLRAMEGLRGFAVLLVFLVHYVAQVRPAMIAAGSTALQAAGVLHALGHTGVDLFFVLSGHLIYASLMSRRQRLRPFLSRRLQRIYPAFLVVFAAYVVLSFLFPAENKIPGPLLPDGAIYLLQNLLLLPGLFPVEPMISVAWSLSYEAFYYLALPLLVALLRLRERSRRWRVLFFGTTALAFVLYCAFFEGPLRLVMFVAGILLHETLAAGPARVPGGAVSLLLLGGASLATLVLPATPAGSAVKVLALFPAFFVLCLCCFARPGDWLSRAFCWTPLRWLGNMSYSYYLVHGLALQAAFLVLARLAPDASHDAAFFWTLLPAMFALTLAPAAALFLAVERPFSLAAPRSSRRGGAKASLSPDPQALPVDPARAAAHRAP